MQHRENVLRLEAAHDTFDEEFDSTPGDELAPAEPQTRQLLALNEFVDEVIGDSEHLGGSRH